MLGDQVQVRVLFLFGALGWRAALAEGCLEVFNRTFHLVCSFIELTVAFRGWRALFGSVVVCGLRRIVLGVFNFAGFFAEFLLAAGALAFFIYVAFWLAHGDHSLDYIRFFNMLYHILLFRRGKRFVKYYVKIAAGL